MIAAFKHKQGGQDHYTGGSGGAGVLCQAHTMLGMPLDEDERGIAAMNAMLESVKFHAAQTLQVDLASGNAVVVDWDQSNWVSLAF